MKSSTAFACRMISIPAIAGLLVALWCDAASAQQPQAQIECTALDAPLGTTVQLDSDCTSQPLHNGRVGETVRSCATVRYARVAFFLRRDSATGKRTPFKGYCAPASRTTPVVRLLPSEG